MSPNPMQLAYYKGITSKFGCVQFNPQRPHQHCPNCKQKDFEARVPGNCPNCEGVQMKSREGVIFMEITSAKGPNDYDWSNKIVMALGIPDLGKILTVLEGLKEEAKIMHDPGAKSTTAGKVHKYLTVSSPKGIKEGVLFNAAVKNSDGQIIKHMVPLSCDETRVLAACISAFLPVSLAWSL
jgi:hypothetical protein